MVSQLALHRKIRPGILKNFFLTGPPLVASRYISAYSEFDPLVNESLSNQRPNSFIRLAETTVFRLGRVDVNENLDFKTGSETILLFWTTAFCNCRISMFGVALDTELCSTHDAKPNLKQA